MPPLSLSYFDNINSEILLQDNQINVCEMHIANRARRFHIFWNREPNRIRNILISQIRNRNRNREIETDRTGTGTVGTENFLRTTKVIYILSFLDHFSTNKFLIYSWYRMMIGNVKKKANNLVVYTYRESQQQFYFFL
jgi:hypothetical protein